MKLDDEHDVKRTGVASPTPPVPSTAPSTPTPSTPPATSKASPEHQDPTDNAKYPLQSPISAAFKCTNRLPEIPYNYFFPDGYLDNPDRYKVQPQRDEDTITAEIILNHISRMEKLPPEQVS